MNDTNPIWTVNSKGTPLPITVPAIMGHSITSLVKIGFTCLDGSCPKESIVFAADATAGQVLAITESGAVLNEATVGIDPAKIVYDPYTFSLLVTNRGSDTVTSIPLSSFNPTTIQLPANSHPDGEALDPKSGLLYVADSGTNSISILDPSKNSVVDAIPVPASPYELTFWLGGLTGNLPGISSTFNLDPISKKIAWLNPNIVNPVQVASPANGAAVFALAGPSIIRIDTPLATWSAPSGGPNPNDFLVTKQHTAAVFPDPANPTQNPGAIVWDAGSTAPRTILIGINPASIATAQVVLTPPTVTFTVAATPGTTISANGGPGQTTPFTVSGQPGSTVSLSAPQGCASFTFPGGSAAGQTYSFRVLSVPETVTAICGTTNPTPILTSLAPSTAEAGGLAFTLTVGGSGFVPGSVASFNGTSEPTTVLSSGSLTAAVPATAIATAGTYSVIVTNPAPGGGASTSLSFTVNNPIPTVQSIVPSTAQAGGLAFTLTVAGSGFGSGSVASFNGANLPTTVTSAGLLTAAVPASAITTGGIFPVVVTNPLPGGGASTSQSFTVNNPNPTVQSLVPSTAQAGGLAFTLTVAGSGFGSGSVASFNGANLPTTVTSAGLLTAAVPATAIATAGPDSVTVTNPAPGGGQSNTLTFTAFAPFSVACPAASATLGAPYSSLASTTGGLPPYSNYHITVGALPPGLILNPNSGAVTGTPTAVGGTFIIAVSDSSGATASSAPGCFIAVQ